MALFRTFSALLATLLLAGPSASAAADKPLTVETVVAKARAALADDAAALDKVKTLRMEFVAYDPKGAEINVTGLTLATPGYRLQKTTERNRNFETAVCSGRLEGWTTRKLDALSSREVRSVPYEEFKKLQDMSRDDLAFFAIPAAGVGTAAYKGLSEVDGRKTHAVEYAYASGFRITRHFDAETFALVASDQPTPKGELQRQKVEALTKVDGITFPSKETITIDGKKSGEVTYDHIVINPAVPAGLFDFPSF
jgi:outer membrane lipoprotein-sorting protein